MRAADLRRLMFELDPSSILDRHFRQAFSQRDSRTSMQWVSAFPTAARPISGELFAIGFCCRINSTADHMHHSLVNSRAQHQ